MKDIGLSSELKDGDQKQLQKILAIHKGDLKNDPLLGVGVADFTDDETNPTAMVREIRENFERDGAQVDRFIVVEQGKVMIDANYNG